MGLLQILIIAGLILINAYFVAAEFALVKVRTSQIDQMVERGNWAARITSKALDKLDVYLSASQIGITVASLALGRAIQVWVEPLVGSSGCPASACAPLAPDAWSSAISTAARCRSPGADAGHLPAHGAGRAGPQDAWPSGLRGFWRCSPRRRWCSLLTSSGL